MGSLSALLKLKLKLCSESPPLVGLSDAEDNVVLEGRHRVAKDSGGPGDLESVKLSSSDVGS